MRKYQREYMEMAIRLARQNVKSGKGGPFGAVIVKDGQVIASAMNEVIADDDPTAHAEVVAIRRACKELGTYQLQGCDIYSSCEPCPMCLGAIYWARPEKVYFAANRKDAAGSGFDDDFIYDEISIDPEMRKIPFVNVMRDMGIEAFKEWDESGLKINY
ncbi:MAG: nucleoside deaminase [Bacteroidales bacterium]|jgi:tRNA(Arg) A34 adenosine deaminase TadA|nr:nucleoside deaminase [Bacteroidales bacterium]